MSELRVDRDGGETVLRLHREYLRPGDRSEHLPIGQVLPAVVIIAAGEVEPGDDPARRIRIVDENVHGPWPYAGPIDGCMTPGEAQELAALLVAAAAIDPPTPQEAL